MKMANTAKQYRRNYGKKDNFRLRKTETKDFWEISRYNVGSDEKKTTQS